MKYSIVITTFSKRLDSVCNLMKQIREHTNNQIILTINGEKNGNVNENYRKSILKFCSEHENIFPIYFTEIRGLAKLWNSGTINSYEDNVLILNDDLIVTDPKFFDECDEIVKQNKNMVLFNESFSHFFINKKFLNEIGYFDEGLLGFGWEDNDMMMRYKEHTNQKIDIYNTYSIRNESSLLGHDDIQLMWGKYTLYNFEYFKTKYQNPVSRLYECGMRLKDEINPYPLESNFLNNKNLIFINENN